MDLTVMMDKGEMLRTSFVRFPSLNHSPLENSSSGRRI